MSGTIAKGMLQGDPKRTAEVKRYQRKEKVKGEDAFAEPLLMGGMMMGLGGLLLKMRLLAWGALVTTVMGLAYARPDTDLKQIMSSLVFAVMSVFQSYSSALRPPAPAASDAGGAGA